IAEHAQRMEVCVENRCFFLPLSCIFLSQLDDGADGLGVEPVALGFGEYVADIGRDTGLFLFEFFHAADDAFELIDGDASDPVVSFLHTRRLFWWLYSSAVRLSQSPPKVIHACDDFGNSFFSSAVRSASRFFCLASRAACRLLLVFIRSSFPVVVILRL